MGAPPSLAEGLHLALFQSRFVDEVDLVGQDVGGNAASDRYLPAGWSVLSLLADPSVPMDAFRLDPESLRSAEMTGGLLFKGRPEVLKMDNIETPSNGKAGGTH